MDAKTIGMIVYYARNKRDIGQTELAARARCTQSAVTSIERAREKYYTKNQLIKVLETLMMDPSLINDENLSDLLGVKDKALCACISAHFATLTIDQVRTFRVKFNEFGIPTDFSDYIPSASIAALMKTAIGSENLPLIFYSSISLENLMDRSDQAKVLDQKILDAVIGDNENNPFLKICAKLNINYRDDTVLIREFIDATSVIKFVRPGRILEAIEIFSKEFLRRKEGFYW